MSQAILYIDRSEIRPGRTEDVKDAVEDLVAFIEEREPQLLSYGFSIDEQTSEMTVLAVHPDSDSLETHLDVGGPAFRGFADLIDLRSIEVYGDPSPPVRDQLRKKAEALGDNGRLVVRPLHAGFARFGA